MTIRTKSALFKNSVMRGGQSWLVIALLMLVGSISLSQPTSEVDLLLLNASVMTMNERQPRAQAVAIKGERIAWVGSNAEAKKLFPHPTRLVDLGGATVLPGIIDGHAHLLSLGESFLKINLKDAATPEQVVQLVKQQAASVAPGEWILGWGWDEGKWAARYPTHHELSAAFPNNPVLLTGLHSFASWANAKAMEIAGITRETKDPENGKVIRDEQGVATGIFTNRAQNLVTTHLPPLTPAQVKKAIELAAEECVRHGLTSVADANVTPIMLQAFRELIDEGKLPLRIYAMLDGTNKAFVEEWLARGPQIDSAHHQLTIRSFKLFADGALGSRGAALFEPYSDQPSTTGVMTLHEFDIYNFTRHALQKGFQVATHAIGDAANRATLDAYEKAMKETPQAKDPRLRVEHAQVMSLDDIPRFAKLRVIASMQPTHCTSDMVWAEKRVGPARIKGAYAWRAVLKTGAHLTLNTDFPGETLDPFSTIYAAITRQDPEGNPPSGWYPKQRLTLDEALRGYFREAAYAQFEETVKGSLEKGKLADLIVISQDITKVQPKGLLSTRVLKAFIDGKLVYEASQAVGKQEHLSSPNR